MLNLSDKAPEQDQHGNQQGSFENLFGQPLIEVLSIDTRQFTLFVILAVC